MFAVGPRTIFVTVAGSHAHGTAGPGSDVDLRGVCVAPSAWRLSLFRRFEQYEGALPDSLAEPIGAGLRRRGLDPGASELECVIYDVAKFLGLCAKANPAALEILYADEGDWLHATPVWRRVYAERARFLTRRVEQTFLGYALAQLRRIRTHRSWLLQPPAARPTRAAFGLPDEATLSRDDRNRIEQGLAEKMRRYGVDDLELDAATRIALGERLRELWIDLLAVPAAELDDRMRTVAGAALRLPPEVGQAVSAERRYRAAMKHWQSYERWRAQRNRARAELERRHGYDTKHAMHLLRLMRMGLEALTTGELRVRRADNAELAAVRDGALSFEELEAAAEALRARLAEAGQASALPDAVDPDVVDALLRSVIEEAG